MDEKRYTIKWQYRKYGLAGDAKISATKAVAETVARIENKRSNGRCHHWIEPVEWQHYTQQPWEIRV